MLRGEVGAGVWGVGERDLQLVVYGFAVFLTVSMEVKKVVVVFRAAKRCLCGCKLASV